MRHEAAIIPKYLLPCILTLCLLAICAGVRSQLRGTHLLGDMGLQSGSQAPPGFALLVAMDNYHSSKFVTSDGSKIQTPDINMFLVGVGGSVVTNAKILGGNYGASILVAFASSKIEGDLVSTKSSLAFTDMYVQPLQLGWNTKQADFSFGYALYLPTGRYELGAKDNAGLGILTNEFSGGSTVYFDSKKEWNFSALLSYGFNSPKKNTKDNEIKVGDLLSIEGGLGKTWYMEVKGTSMPMIINGGLVYYAQYKITPDQMNFPSLGGFPVDLGNKDHIYALGAEANIFIPTIKWSVLFRWLGELGASNRTQGNSFFITVAPYMKFFAPVKK